MRRTRRKNLFDEFDDLLDVTGSVPMAIRRAFRRIIDLISFSRYNKNSKTRGSAAGRDA